MNRIFELFKKTESNRHNKSIDFIVAGLGNPGIKYRNTRHNAGFLALSYIAQKKRIDLNRSKFKSLYSEGYVDDRRGLYIAPQTFMNLSGESIFEASSFYKIPTENILVIFDDTTLPIGKIRIRKNGSDGGHNGIKSITDKLSSNMFPRIKIGVGNKPHPDMDLADWVLSSFSEQEKKQLFEVFENVYDASELILSGKIEKAMNLYN